MFKSFYTNLYSDIDGEKERNTLVKEGVFVSRYTNMYSNILGETTSTVGDPRKKGKVRNLNYVKVGDANARNTRNRE